MKSLKYCIERFQRRHHEIGEFSSECLHRHILHAMIMGQRVVEPEFFKSSWKDLCSVHSLKYNIPWFQPFGWHFYGASGDLHGGIAKLIRSLCTKTNSNWQEFDVVGFKEMEQEEQDKEQLLVLCQC